MKKLLMILPVFSCVLLAADTAAPVTKLMTFRYTNAQDVLPIIPALGITASIYRIDNSVLLSGTSEKVAAAEEMLKKLDVPRPMPGSVEIKVYLILASQKPDDGKPTAELDSILKQVRPEFSYKAYRLLDVAALRVRSGQGATTHGMIPYLDGSPNCGDYRLGFKTVNLIDLAESAVEITGLEVNVSVPETMTTTTVDGKAQTQVMQKTVGISTDLVFKEGQQVIVGKSNLDGKEDALIVVLAARAVH
jgi:hypothetical protein